MWRRAMATRCGEMGHRGGASLLQQQQSHGGAAAAGSCLFMGDVMGVGVLLACMQVCFYWEGNDVGHDAVVTYKQLLDMVCQVIRHGMPAHSARANCLFVYASCCNALQTCHAPRNAGMLTGGSRAYWPRCHHCTAYVCAMTGLQLPKVHWCEEGRRRHYLHAAGAAAACDYGKPGHHICNKRRQTRLCCALPTASMQPLTCFGDWRWR